MHKIDDHPYTNDTITKTQIDQLEICPHIAVFILGHRKLTDEPIWSIQYVLRASAKTYYKYSILDSTK